MILLHKMTVVVFVSVYLTFCVVSAESWPPPPPFMEKARMARYLVHYGSWGVFSAISPDFGNVPFGTVQSFADGPMGNSTGSPYFYIASLSDTYKNMMYNNSVSLTISQAESDYCEKKGFDPEEPTCARVIVTGQILPVASKEHTFAKKSLFSRHPAMKSWPSGHDWNFYKIHLKAVCLLDFYGGASHVPLKDYFAAQPNSPLISNN